MKQVFTTCILLICITLSIGASAQQVVDSPVKQKVIATRSNYTSAVANVDVMLSRNREELAFKSFHVAMDILKQNIAEIKDKIKSANGDGEKLMLTEKLTAQQKHYDKLHELSTKLAQNRTLVNIEFKEALKNM